MGAWLEPPQTRPRDRLTRTTPLFVSGDAAGLSALPGVAFVYRSTIWTSSLAPDAIHTWDVEDVLADTARAARTIEAVADGDLQLTGPTRELQAARATRREGTAVLCATHDDEIVGRADATIDLDALAPLAPVSR